MFFSLSSCADGRYRTGLPADEESVTDNSLMHPHINTLSVSMIPSCGCGLAQEQRGLSPRLRR